MATCLSSASPSNDHVESSDRTVPETRFHIEHNRTATASITTSTTIPSISTLATGLAVAPSNATIPRIPVSLRTLRSLSTRGSRYAVHTLGAVFSNVFNSQPCAIKERSLDDDRTSTPAWIASTGGSRLKGHNLGRALKADLERTFNRQTESVGKDQRSIFEGYCVCLDVGVFVEPGRSGNDAILRKDQERNHKQRKYCDCFPTSISHLFPLSPLLTLGVLEVSAHDPANAVEEKLPASALKTTNGPKTLCIK